MFSIGGNHLIHAMRRNVNLTILMFNNQIYGLTKGQYSPTSEVGKITKSSPFGSLDTPFNPVSVALGAEGTFVARTHDIDRKHMIEMFRRAHEHRGAVVRRGVPELQRLQRRRVRRDHRAGASFGDAHRPAARRAGPVRRRWSALRGPEPVRECELADTADVDESRILVHDEHRADPALAFSLSRLADRPTTPTPMGVFRDVALSHLRG